MKIRIDTKPFRGKSFLRFEQILANLSHVPDRIACVHLDKNEKIWEDYLRNKPIKYIEDQHSLTFLEFGRCRKLWDKLFSGGRSINAAFCSCEVIAIYNALLNLNQNGSYPSFPKLLYYFEKRYTMLSGYFGTSILGLYRYFSENGYRAEYFSGKKITKENVDRLEKEYDTYVFMSFNDSKNVTNMIHTMCITKEAEGYFIHNAYSNTFYESLFDAVKNYNSYKDNVSAPIIVMGIKK